MIIHYLKNSFRQLLKYKTQAIVSILGLAVGFTAFSFSALWMHYETTYDTFHEGADRIFIATNPSNFYADGGVTVNTSEKLAPYLLANFPEIEATTTLKTRNGLPIGYMELTPYREMKIEKDFNTVFPIKVIEGDLQELFRNSQAIAITQSLKQHLFGEKSAIGQQDSLYSNRTVVAVVEDWKGHSNITFDYLSAVPESWKYNSDDPMLWNTRSVETYFRVHRGADIKALEKKLAAIQVVDNWQGKLSDKPISMIPIRELHYKFPKDKSVIGLYYIRLFLVVGMLIVLAALFNYMIMYMIRIRMRQREWALRRVNGASNGNLLTLLLTEIIVLLFVASLVSIALTEWCLPTFQTWSGIIREEPSFFFKQMVMFMCIPFGGALLFAWISLLLQQRSSLQQSIVSSHSHYLSKMYRRVGLGLQLFISIAFVFCTIVMMKQLYHLHHSADMGLLHPNVECVQAGDTYEQIEISSGQITMKKKSLDTEGWNKMVCELPGIEATKVGKIPLPITSETQVIIGNWEGKYPEESNFQASQFYITREVIDALGIQILSGTFPEYAGNDNYIFINETFLKQTGWGDAVGKYVYVSNTTYKVAGVLKNICLSPTLLVIPSIYIVSDNSVGNCYVYTCQGDRKTIKNEIQMRSNELGVNWVSFYNVSDRIEEAIVSERMLIKLLSVASLVCILIAMFGIFSLVSLSCEQRRKEIAVRKINGATLLNILCIFSREYMLVLLLAATVAFSIGYVVMKRWLEHYVVQTPMSWWLYASIFVGITLIIVLCVGWRIWQAAHRNPIEELKKE